MNNGLSIKDVSVLPTPNPTRQIVLPSLKTSPRFVSAYGYVMGDQHLVTFDQTHYNFAGRCSYILARDMVDDSFTVVVNYNNRPRQPQIQSIIVQLRLVAVEVDRDGKVYKDTYVVCSSLSSLYGVLVLVGSLHAHPKKLGHGFQ